MDEPNGLHEQPILRAVLDTAAMCAAEAKRDILGERDLVQAVVEEGMGVVCTVLGSRALVEDLVEDSLGDLPDVHVVEIPEEGRVRVKAPGFLKDAVEAAIEWKPDGTGGMDLLGALVISGPEFSEWLSARVGRETAAEVTERLTAHLVGRPTLDRWKVIRDKVKVGSTGTPKGVKK